MGKQFIIGVVLALASVGIGAARGPTAEKLKAKDAKTLLEDRDRLTGEMSALQLRLAAVQAEIARRKLDKPLPAYWVEENAGKWAGDAYNWAKQVRFGAIQAPKWGTIAWGDDVAMVWRCPPGPRPLQVEVEVTALALGKDKTVFTEFHAGRVGMQSQEGQILLDCHPSNLTFRSLTPPPTPTNIHVAVSLGGVRVYEALWKYDSSAKVAPNGIPWSRDASLRCKPAPR
jgi:hypothetical protein